MTYVNSVARAAIFATIALLGPTAAHATVAGSAFFVTQGQASNAVIGFPRGAPDATFTVPSPSNPACTGSLSGDTLCFLTDNGPGTTLGNFLTGGGATILTGTAAALGTTLDNGSNA
jgi:hypothetical protein